MYDPGQGQNIPGQPPLGSEATLYQSVGAPPPPPPMPRKKSRRGRWILLVIVVLLLIGGATTAIILVVTGPSRAVNSVVQSYYSAVEQQDYATAYTYLDRQYTISSGLQIRLSQNAYTLTANATDLAAGKLTAYTITNTEIANGIATVTLNVTRGGTVRQVSVQLLQIGGNWEIDKISQA